MILLDASAALAYLLREPGGETVRGSLSHSTITSVNLIEVGRRPSRGLNEQQVAAVVGKLEEKLCNVEDVKMADVLTASGIYASY